jgi:hypothetical protein
VLEPNYHLSFPYIFEDAGSIFLIPESAANGTVDLYRATAFPHKWEHVARLLDVPGLDTVILPRDGLYWMFTTVCEPRGASGQLVLLSSPTLTGTYQLHRQTPITADARFARSAGRIFEYNGALIRPSQDASGTYGSAIHLRRVTDLTPELYCEEPFADIAPPQGFRGLHSYDRAKGLEVIDGKRWELARRVLAAKP